PLRRKIPKTLLGVYDISAVRSLFHQLNSITPEAVCTALLGYEELPGLHAGLIFKIFGSMRYSFNP
ncbi:MAG: hypothetical protein H6Q92_1965, partial [Nitrospirae bacterium]|nr:hypothetical protein [Nitrospirota bacterium]